MRAQTINGLRLLLFDSFGPHPRLWHAVSTRIGGISPAPFAGLNLGLHVGDAVENVMANYQALSKALDFKLEGLITSHQVHGARAVCVRQRPLPQKPLALTHTFDGFDALITDQPGLALMIRVADCVPILLFDPATMAVAVVHAGWKGTLAGVVPAAVREMSAQCGSKPAMLIAGIGPSIGPCCYHVQHDTAAHFSAAYADAARFLRPHRQGFALDLQEANRLQLLAAGCREQKIEVCGLCTACNLDLFFSHRGEQGKAGRFGLLAGLRL